MNRAHIAALALGAMGGCTTYPTTTEQTAPRPPDDARPVDASTYRPTADQPMVAADGTPINKTSVALPTGDRATSAILLERTTPAEVVAGQSYDYEVRVTNLTPMTLDGVVVTDSIPAGFRMSRSTPESQPGEKGLTAWNLGSLGPRETRTIKVTGAVPETGTVRSCVTASYTNGLCSEVAIVRPELRLTMAAPEHATTCDPIPLRYTVTNVGTGTARNIRITQRLPDGLAASDGRNAVELNVGSLSANQSRDVTANVRAAGTGVYQASAVAAANGDLHAESSVASIDVRRPVLSITKTGPERLFLGRPAAYEITVTNTGDAPAVNTVVEDHVPVGATFAGSSDGGRTSGNTVVWSLGTLAPHESRKVTSTLNFANPGNVRASATAKANCAETVTVTTGTELAGVPALLLDGVDSPDPVQVGQTTTYTLTLTNQGSAPVTDVRLVCTMDDAGAMEYISADGPPSPVAVEGRKVNFVPIPTLEPRQSATYRITVRAAKEGQAAFRAEATSREITVPLIKSETTNFYR